MCSYCKLDTVIPSTYSNSCCYSKPGSSQCTILVAKISQLFQVWHSYSECLLGITVSIPSQARVNALLGLLHSNQWKVVFACRCINSTIFTDKIKIRWFFWKHQLLSVSLMFCFILKNNYKNDKNAPRLQNTGLVVAGGSCD